MKSISKLMSIIMSIIITIMNKRMLNIQKGIIRNTIKRCFTQQINERYSVRRINMKKRLSLLVVCMLLIVSCLQVNAAEPKGSVYLCTKCHQGQVITSVSRKYQHDETFPCTHHDNGIDVYKVYEVKETRKCNSCSYSSTYSYEEHVLRNCSGY